MYDGARKWGVGGGRDRRKAVLSLALFEAFVCYFPSSSPRGNLFFYRVLVISMNSPADR